MTTRPDGTFIDPIRTAVEGRTGGAMLVASSVHHLGAMIRATLAARPAQRRLLSTERALNAVLDEFIPASRTAQAVASDDLEIRAVDSMPDEPVITSEDRLTLLLTAGETVTAVETAEQPFVGEAHGHFIKRWEAGTEYTLATPPVSCVRRSLREEFDAEMSRDFDAMIDAGAGTELGTVERFLLIAAKRRELLSDIGAWGEDMGIASRATFSRTKARLERQGVIGTENVRGEIGRPRQRLLLGDARLDGLAIAHLLRTADDLVRGNVRGARVPA